MARESTLNVSLTGPLRNYVRAKVTSGRYESASEVVRDALRALQEREQAAAGYWVDVRAKVAVARGQIADGKTVDGEPAMDALIDELDAEAEKPRRRTGGPTRRRKGAR